MSPWALEASMLVPLSPSATVPLSRTLDFLRRRESYPEATAGIEATETHMSWVFLTDQHAYKLKKPVKTAFLDFSSPDLRRHWCEEEVRLNRRLAADTYLGVVSLTVSSSGALQLGGHGTAGHEAIDWLVKMRRLPAKQMLDQVIASERLESRDIKAIAERLAGFYRVARPVPMHPVAHRRRLEAEIEDCRRELKCHGSRLPPARIEYVTEALRAFLTRHAAEFDRRVAAGFMIEGHGDLRPEHVFIGPPPQIIDCIEFNRTLRILDPVDDLAMLAMECDRLGVPAVGHALFAAYGAATKDRPPESFIGFYRGLRAVVRAKLAIWHLKDAVVADPPKWQNRGQSYLELASREASRLSL